MWGAHTRTHTLRFTGCTQSRLLQLHDLIRQRKTQTVRAHSQYDEVSRSVWLKCKFLTVENFESVSFAGLSVDFRWLDGDGEQARVLYSEDSFEGEVWLFDFCLWNTRNIIHKVIAQQKGKACYFSKTVFIINVWLSLVLCDSSCIYYIISNTPYHFISVTLTMYSLS